MRTVHRFQPVEACHLTPRTAGADEAQQDATCRCKHARQSARMPASGVSLAVSPSAGMGAWTTPARAAFAYCCSHDAGHSLWDAGTCMAGKHRWQAEEACLRRWLRERSHRMPDDPRTERAGG